MTVTINGTTGIANDGGYTGDGVVFADTTPANTLVTTNGGNVGIGTSSPLGKMTVRGLSGYNLTIGAVGTDARIDATNDNGSGSVDFVLSGSNLKFNASGAERMRIASSGNISLAGSTGATATPQSISFSLDYSNSSVAAGCKLFLYNGTATDTYGFGVGADSDIQYHAGGVPTNNNGKHRFFTNNTERARITPGGNLLVGTTNSAVGIGDLTTATGAQFAPEGYVGATRASEAAAYFTRTGSDGRVVNCYKNSSNVGGISVATSSTSFNTSSDYRLKENIAPMTGALAKVAELKPVTYTWKVDGADGQGFIAHELQAVVPDAVVGEKDAVDQNGKPIYQGIDTSFLVATLTAAIQELKAINDAQAQTITALTARVTALEGQP